MTMCVKTDGGEFLYVFVTDVFFGIILKSLGEKPRYVHLIKLVWSV